MPATLLSHGASGMCTSSAPGPDPLTPDGALASELTVTDRSLLETWLGTILLPQSRLWQPTPSETLCGECWNPTQ